MKTLFAAVTVGSALIAGHAQACVVRYWDPFFAEGRVRVADGEWRDISIEASFGNVRIETDDLRTPWGRLTVTGNLGGEATVFSVAKEREAPKIARLAWKTSLAEALSQAGLGTAMLDGLPSLQLDIRDGPHAINGFECFYPAIKADLRMRSVGPYRQDICLTDKGVPVIMNDSAGKRIYELRKVTFRSIPDARFKAPQGWIVTDRMPAYLTKWDCGGGKKVARNRNS